MSVASERKAIRDLLPKYCLISIEQCGKLWDCDGATAQKTIEEFHIPTVKVGSRFKVDPVDAAVHILAQREGITFGQYMEKYGDAAAENAGRYFGRVRRFLAA